MEFDGDNCFRYGIDWGVCVELFYLMKTEVRRQESGDKTQNIEHRIHNSKHKTQNINLI